MDVLLEVAECTLRDEMTEPLDRILGYFEAIGEIAGPARWLFGCMLANLGLELPMHSELVRERLLAGFEDLKAPFAEAIADGQARGQVRWDLAADKLAIVVLAAWHGALLKAKVEQCGTAPKIIAGSLPLPLRPTVT